MKIEDACHPVISECPFNYIIFAVFFKIIVMIDHGNVTNISIFAIRILLRINVFRFIMILFVVVLKVIKSFINDLQPLPNPAPY